MDLNLQRPGAGWIEREHHPDEAWDVKERFRHKLVDVEDMRIYFRPRRVSMLRRIENPIRAVDGVSLSIFRGETLALVGESGSGKSSLGRGILRLHPLTGGRVVFDGIDLSSLSSSELRRTRRRMQLIFQDPYSSLNPRMSVETLIGEPMEAHGLTRGDQTRERVLELLSRVGMPATAIARYPHEFSGGQRQRIGVARALAVNPDFIVADEPVSALDVSVQAQVLNLLQDLQSELDLTYLFLAHDLAVVRQIASRVAVMYLGKIVEVAATEDLYEEPLHPYTTALLAAVPVPDPVVARSQKPQVLKGEIPSPANPPSGCRFRTRCPLREALGDPAVCAEAEPALAQTRPQRWVACHFDGQTKLDSVGAAARSSSPERRKG